MLKLIACWDLKEHPIKIIIIKDHKAKISIEFPESANLEKSYFSIIIHQSFDFPIMQEFETLQHWRSIHSFDGISSCSCTSISVNQIGIVSVGEDGVISVLPMESSKPTRKIGNDGVFLIM